MANRLKLKLDHMGMALDFAEQHIAKQNFEGAVVVLHAAMKQLVATLAGEDMNNQSDPDITIYTQRECMVSIDDIKEICAKTLGVSVAEIESRKRTQDVALARQCAIFYSRKQGYKVEELGKVFDRNHSNISHTVNKIHDLLECDPEMASKINLVGRNINGQN